jgi:sulfoquinovose isomerase
MKQIRAEPGEHWTSWASHRRWLLNEADKLLSFFADRSIDPQGGFYTLTTSGTPQDTRVKDLVSTARMVHCYSLATLLGYPDAERVAQQGLNALWELFLDDQQGGFYWSVDAEGAVVDGTKRAYGQAFALLAGSSAHQAGLEDGLRLIDAADQVLETHFWEPEASRYREEFSPRWDRISSYRGGNSNMHLVEALVAAFEATDDTRYLSRASSVASALIDNVARGYGWRTVEHFHDNWEIDEYYNRETPRDTYRPYGIVVGHALEWARLLLQLRGALGADGWHLEAAEQLFSTAMRAWDDEQGGLFYTTDFHGQVLDRDHYQWPIAEGIGAAASLVRTTGRGTYEQWYRDLWCFAASHLVDRISGGWFNLLDEHLAPVERPGVSEGKTEPYHALQCCLVPLLDPGRGLAAGLRLSRRAEKGITCVDL